MEQVKNDTAAESRVKLYRSPEACVVFVKVQRVLCVSNEPMRECDYGTGGFDEA